MRLDSAGSAAIRPSHGSAKARGAEGDQTSCQVLISILQNEAKDSIASDLV